MMVWIIFSGVRIGPRSSLPHHCTRVWVDRSMTKSAMMRWRWRDCTTVRWRCAMVWQCDGDDAMTRCRCWNCTMAMERCSVAQTELCHSTIVIRWIKMSQKLFGYIFDSERPIVIQMWQLCINVVYPIITDIWLYTLIQDFHSWPRYL